MRKTGTRGQTINLREHHKWKGDLSLLKQDTPYKKKLPQLWERKKKHQERSRAKSGEYKPRAPGHSGTQKCVWGTQDTNKAAVEWGETPGNNIINELKNGEERRSRTDAAKWQNPTMAKHQVVQKGFSFVGGMKDKMQRKKTFGGRGDRTFVRCKKEEKQEERKNRIGGGRGGNAKGEKIA